MITWLCASALAADVVVVDRAVGDPVAGAEVRAEGGPVGTTDDRGRVTLDLQGGQVVRVEAEGFAPRTLAIEAPVPDVLRVHLEDAPVALEVVVESFRPSAHPTRHVVDAEQALETPGNHEDAVRLVQSLPGVTVQREYAPSAGSLSVRGAAPGDSRYLLDGIEVPYLYHFNQYASVFPASQLSTLELFPSTFSAAYGDAVGGVVDARSQLEPPSAIHGSAHMSFVMAGGDLRAPVGRDGWWLSASGRRSFLDLAGEQSAQYPVWPRFHDFALRAERGDGDSGTGAFAWGAGDDYDRAAGELDVLDPYERTTTPSFSFGQAFQVVGAHHRWSREGTRGRAVVAGLHHHLAGELTGAGRQELDSLAGTARVDAELRPDGPVGVDLGAEVRPTSTRLAVVDPSEQALLVAAEAPALARGVAVDDGLARTRGGVYGTVHLAGGPVRVMPGLRLSADSAGGGVQAGPRLAARVRAGPQTELKAGGGWYHQRPDDEHLIGAADLPTTHSWQATAGLEQTVAGRLEVLLDGYAKWLTDPLAFPVDGPVEVVPRGDALGIELATRYRLRERFFLWGWVALSQARLEDATGERRPADGDQLVSGGVVASLDVGGFNLGARWRYASGLPYTPVSSSIYDAGRDTWLPIPDDDNSARLPAYTKLDLRVAHEWALRGWSLQLALEVWIVPPSSAQLYPTWSYDWREQGWVVGPSVLPLLSGRARF